MSENTYSKILNTSKELGVSVKKILDLFSLVSRGKPVENKVLINKLGIAKNLLDLVKEKLHFYFERPSTHTVLSKSGRAAIKEIKEYLELPLESEILNTIENRDSKTAIHDSVFDFQRPDPRRNYDQFLANNETTSKRAALMDFLSDINQKRILFLGDDDFTSVVTASLESKADRIQVLDIDDRILAMISATAKRKKLKIDVAKYDAVNALPDEYINSFDIVFTDPPYTKEGVRLFVSRAIDALDKENKAARVYFCYGNSDRAKEKFISVYEVIVEMGLMARWVFDKFNKYEEATSIGSTSTLFVCEITPKTKATIKGDYKNKIYTNN